MKSLFDPKENQEIIDRIQNLSVDATALWGKMKVSQMLKHCEAPLKVAFGELKLKRGLLGVLFGNMAKKKMTNDKPFEKNIPTDKMFKVNYDPEFAPTKEELIILVKRFADQGPSGLMSAPHPFFGKLTAQEWDILQWKHLDHHLRQFGN